MAETVKVEMRDVPTFARIEEDVGASVAKAWERFHESAAHVGESQASHAGKVAEMVASLMMVYINSSKGPEPTRPSCEEIASHLVAAGVVRTRQPGEQPLAYKQQATPYIWLAKHSDESLLTEEESKILQAKGGVRVYDNRTGTAVEYRDPCSMMWRSGYSWTRVYGMFKGHYTISAERERSPQALRPDTRLEAIKKWIGSDREAAVAAIGELLDACNGRLPRVALQQLAEKLAMMKSLEDAETERQTAKRPQAALEPSEGARRRQPKQAEAQRERQPVRLVVLREGKRALFDVTVARSEDAAPAAIERTERAGKLGLTVEPLTPDLAGRLGQRPSHRRQQEACGMTPPISLRL